MLKAVADEAVRRATNSVRRAPRRAPNSVADEAVRRAPRRATNSVADEAVRKHARSSAQRIRRGVAVRDEGRMGRVGAVRSPGGRGRRPIIAMFSFEELLLREELLLLREVEEVLLVVQKVQLLPLCCPRIGPEPDPICRETTRGE